MNSVLITGGTGSFGQAYVKKLLAEENKFASEKIVIYSRDEQKQEKMYRDFNYHPRLRMLLGDVRDKARLSLALSDCTQVIHAAALKIVPALEYNPMECLKTNVIGTQNLIEAIQEKSHGPNRSVILLSTDKAVSPINLYGASKACAERLFTAANNVNSGHKFSVVRYGNVATSRGSVIPLFHEQMANNIPMSITNEAMTRFWISLEDAASLVYRRLIDMDCNDVCGGEIYIPYMKSFRVIDLAKCFCQYYGKHFENSIKYIGTRPGEKIHEEIMNDYEADKGYYIKAAHEDADYYVITDKSRADFTSRLIGGINSSTRNMRVVDLYDKLEAIGAFPKRETAATLIEGLTYGRV